MKKTKDLTRGEILVGMEQGVFKSGDRFENDAVTLIIDDDRLKYAHSKNPVECDARGYRYDLIEEPAYKMGDWVYEEGGECPVYKIVLTEFLDKLNNGSLPNVIRHATPDEIAAEKQRRWWAALGRKVNEYRVGDVILDQDECLTEIIRIDGGEAQTEFEVIQISGIKRLVTPVEQRLDRSSNEEATD